MNLSKNCKITTALDYASGTADREGAIIDMQGYDGVLMITKFADLAGSCVTTVKAQQDTDDAFGDDPQDLEGTGITVADDDDDEIFVIDLYRPLERYVRLYVDKDAAHASGESAIYVQYSGSKAPVDNNVADAVTCELHISPAEGTA